MKKLLISALLLLSVNVAFSQKFDKKIASSDKSIADAKKGINPKTWISRGELFYEIANNPTENLMAGMDVESYKLVILGTEPAESEETLNEKVYTVHTFDNKKVYLQAGVISFWEVLKYEASDPLKTAYEAFIKAKSLDEGGKNSKKLNEQFTRLALLAKSDAFNKFSLGKYDESVNLFALSIDCSDETGVIDSLSNYYAGVIAMEAKNYPTAEKYLRKAVEIGYLENGDAYAHFADALRELGKVDEARSILEKGIVSNPENQTIVFALINNYMISGKDPKDIIPLIKKAQEKETDNVNLYIVEGDLYEKLNDPDNTIKSYNKAIEVAPTNFFGYYKLGIYHYNIGAKYTEQAVAEKDNKESDRLFVLADKELKASLPFLEKAFELNPEEISTIQALKEINFRFRTENDTFKQNADKYSKLLEEK
jgi:tetratricopeptide (TPR) repeat protein